MMRWRAGVAATVLLCLGLQASSASAQAAASNGIPIHVSLEGGTTLSAGMTDEDSGNYMPVQTCAASCDLHLASGSYTLELRDSNGKLLGTTEISVTKPASYRTTIPDLGGRSSGRTIGILGTVLFAAGGAALVFGGVQSSYFDNPLDGHALFYAGLAGVGLGAVLMPIGWTLYSKNTNWLHESAPSSATAKKRPMSFSVAAWPGTLGALGMVRF
jgi:hypothetical protein